MRKYVLASLFLMFTLVSIAQPVMKVDKPVQHLGFVNQGDTLAFQYVVTNTGNQPLVISDTKVACSCTSVDYPKAPIQPNAQGIIKVHFTTNTAIDRQDRTITVTCNASNSPVELRFKCVVLKSKKKS